ncbi:MAG: TetR family transcriptional regulator [Acidimicrobiales bacterium]
MTQSVDDDVRASDGRVPGRRGLATRRRLVECTGELLKTTPYRQMKVVDIAREAGTSSATFYQYFPNVESAVLELAEDLVHDAEAVVDLVAGPWRGSKGTATARALVAGFVEYWEVHRSVFNVVDLATEEGDFRFRNLRTRALNSLTQALRDAIAESQKDKRIPSDVDAMATASVLVSMMAHVSAHRYGFEFWGIRTSHLEEALTRILLWSVSGQKGPAAR